MEKKWKRGGIVPRAVFAAAVTLASVPSLAACARDGDAAPHRDARRSAELRPLPPSAREPMEPPDLGVDAGIDAGIIDAGIDAGTHHARRTHRHILFGVPRPPPPYVPAVAMRFGVLAL